ncbi:RNA-binding S4 domain-containing protein [Carnobacterium viridans]|uniref:RQC P-site tRNA stabilizing factor n=1 Tax=Carnobacterium viridans TaxID=174587 RepID=A0A1H1ACF6_9LACT|nr:RNA-binding S4 domain-containing protein [Carnobacterium viridans]UDE94207.1 RNA-binding S4 domain-containing protein [Carnobacterium viridans]SDQ37418.1 Ribosomal 50S subunit-recycling heat shock protein, contains S4 domain [Carnobacterium viridans]
MRLDKFLKVSRIIKRRTIAKEVADKGRIQINGIPAKSSSDVKVGDELTISFGNKTLVVKIDKIVETTKKDESKEMFSIVSETYREEPTN